MSELSKSFVEEIRGILNRARKTAITAVNSAMVYAYWEIGKRIVEEEQKGEERASYGKNLLDNLAESLSVNFGKSFDARELRRIRQFYLCFPIRDTVRPELSWSHYRLLIRVEKEAVRLFYIKEAIEQHWSTRKLDRNINSQYFQRILANQSSKEFKYSVLNDKNNLFASKYQLYLPSEEELQQVVEKDL